MPFLVLNYNPVQAARPSVKASELFRILSQSGQVRTMLDKVMIQLKQRVPDEKARLLLEQTLKEAIEFENFTVLDRFPIIPLQKVGGLRSLLAGAGAGSGGSCLDGADFFLRDSLRWWR